MMLAGFVPAQLAFGAILALVMGTDPAMLSEQFPGEYRMSGYSVAFNLGLGVAGGTAPAIATALIAATGTRPSWISPAESPFFV
jgi:MHS family proline/betaine transporter-like MFS transporter